MPKFNSNPTPMEKARRAAGMSRKQLAERSGVSINTIKNYEQRMRKINVSQVLNLVSMSEAIGVPIQKMLLPEGDNEDA